MVTPIIWVLIKINSKGPVIFKHLDPLKSIKMILTFIELRVKYDIFYIENWSLILDLKIILKTFINAIKGEEKAY